MADRPAEKGKATAPESEIEITPEMIEAGLEVLSSFNDDYEDRREFIMRLYEAMAARQKSAI